MQSRVSELEVTSKADQNKVTQSPHTHKTSTLSESSLSVSNKPMTVQTNLNELLHRKMYDEAFVHVLKQNDEFHFVKLISKLSSKSSNFYLCSADFEIDKLSEPIQTAVLKRALKIIQSGEFLDLVLQCLSKTAQMKNCLSL